MEVINIRGPGATAWSASTNENNESLKSPRKPIEDLLIKVGSIVLGDELHTEYMGIGEVARVAQKYKIKWPGMTHRTEQLEELTTRLFENQDRIVGEGIKVTWRTEREGWETELQLRFHRHDPANDGPMPS